jgi:hypothetical protein
LNAFLVEKTPDVKTEIRERVVNYLEALCSELAERFQELEFFKKTLNFVSSLFQEVCKKSQKNGRKTANISGCGKHKLE